MLLLEMNASHSSGHLHMEIDLESHVIRYLGGFSDTMFFHRSSTSITQLIKWILRILSNIVSSIQMFAGFDSVVPHLSF